MSSSSGSSQQRYDDKYRSGSSTSFYTNVAQRTDRKGRDVVIINHNTTNNARDEPRSSDYRSSDVYRKSSK